MSFSTMVTLNVQILGKLCKYQLQDTTQERKLAGHFKNMSASQWSKDNAFWDEIEGLTQKLRKEDRARLINKATNASAFGW